MELGDILHGQIVMPAAEMTNGKKPDLYANFAKVAQCISVYTALDYANIMDHLVK